MTEGVRVAVTGIGLVTALGAGKDANWTAMASGRSGARLIDRFASAGYRTRIAATVAPEIAEAPAPFQLSEALAQLALAEALDESGHVGAPFPGRLAAAVPPSYLGWDSRAALRTAAAANGPPDEPALLEAARHPGFAPLNARVRGGRMAEHLADAIGAAGAPIAVNTACSSGATAIQLAAGAIRRGEAQAAVALGTDGSVTPELLVRFGLLAALSRRNDAPEAASRPFDAGRDGFVPGEGAAALVLEPLATARARGARVLGCVAGWGETVDGHHRTRSDPSGTPAADAMRRAIADAGLSPEDIDYVNAHGTSTPENDRMEALSCKHVFGPRVATLPVSATKSMTGHCLSAAGAIEAAACLLMLQHQTILPTINCDEQDPEIVLDPVVDGPRPARLRHILSNSFGFGGQNVCLVFAGPDVA